MNLSDYALHSNVGDFMTFSHKKSGEVLLNTQFVSLDTLVRLAVVDDARRHNINICKE